jgi:polo-like kinase 1
MEQKNQATAGDVQTQKAPERKLSGGETLPDQPVIIEERISTVSGETAVRKYSKGKLLGKGGFAKCYEFVNLDNKKVLASKVILKSSLTKSRAKQKLLSEIKIHRSLHHPNVVQFEHVFEDSENVYILLELCTNQTLNDLLKRRKRLHELEVQSYTAQLVNAMKYLHQNRIIHRDLKLGNLFLNEKMELKAADFGLATKLEFDGEKKRTICGTPNYIAPEILDGKIGHSYEVDIWSIGVIIYTLIIGKPPFETPDVKTTYKKIRMNNYSFPENFPISEAAKNLITKILNLDPSRRPTLDEIMQHPFINHGGTIPKTLPISTLACPPSASYINQHAPNAKNLASKPKLTETSPLENFNKPNLLTNGSKPTTPKSNVLIPKNFDSETMKRNPTTDTLKDATNFLNTANPNNQGMLASTKDLGATKELGGTKEFGRSDSKDFRSSKGFSMMPGSTAGIGGTSMKNTKQTRAEIHVRKWVDYSTKYGLGYILSNGSCGVFFNDSTKIILEPKAGFFEYIEKRPTDKVDVVNTHTLANYPKDLQKKVTLLQHFRSYLEGDASASIEDIDEESKKAGLVYVKKWLKTKHAIMFRLNNKIVQVDFTDKTEIILSSEQRLVTYMNKKGERSQYPLATALESSNVEMAKRLKYTKDILTNMLNNNQKEKDGKDKDVPIDEDLGN